MIKYRAMFPSLEIRDNPVKLTEWLNGFTSKNNLELVAIDEGIYVFKGVQNEG